MSFDPLKLLQAELSALAKDCTQTQTALGNILETAAHKVEDKDIVALQTLDKTSQVLRDLEVYVRELRHQNKALRFDSEVATQHLTLKDLRLRLSGNSDRTGHKTNITDAIDWF